VSELVSMREYARRRGVSAMAVSKAAKTGRIKLEGGKVDVETADRDWPANTNPGQSAFKASLEAAALEAMSTGAIPGEHPPEGESNGKNGNGHTVLYGASRATREMYLSRIAEIDYKKQTGELVAADTVRALAFKASRAARESLISIPERLAPVLAGESNQFEVHRLLSEEIRRVCDELANAKPV
jgi:hypothetical protein